MSNRQLKNNAELYQLLVQLANSLQNSNCFALAEVVRTASRFVSGSSSEFLHEAQAALKKVINESPDCLSNDELQELRYIVAQIDDAFNSVGGA